VAWPTVVVITVGEHGRTEIFPDDQLDAALRRFEELRAARPGLENSASRARLKVLDCLVRRDWVGSAQVLADDVVHDDRRRGVRLVRRGREAKVDGDRSYAAIGVTYLHSRVIALRGDRLALTYTYGGGDTYRGDAIDLTEVDGQGRVVAQIDFDGDARDAAVAELEDRYLRGEAAPFARTWAAIVQSIATINRHEVPALPDTYGGFDHRPASLPPGNPSDGLRAMLELVPDLTMTITAVHRLDRHGAVISMVDEGTSHDGAAVSWSHTVVITVGEQGRAETFPDDQVDAALARFEELRPR
jgi:hypothetical protein